MPMRAKTQQDNIRIIAGKSQERRNYQELFFSHFQETSNL